MVAARHPWSVVAAVVVVVRRRLRSAKRSRWFQGQSMRSLLARVVLVQPLQRWAVDQLARPGPALPLQRWGLPWPVGLLVWVERRPHPTRLVAAVLVALVGLAGLALQTAPMEVMATTRGMVALALAAFLVEAAAPVEQHQLAASPAVAAAWVVAVAVVAAATGMEWRTSLAVLVALGGPASSSSSGDLAQEGADGLG